MNKGEIFLMIRDWEVDAGESLLDQGFDLYPLTFMTWCLGKGYISKEKYDLWSDAYRSQELEADDANYFVYNDEGDFGAPFAVVISDDFNDEDFEKAYMILSEFISEINVYQEKLIKFINKEN